MNAKHWISGLMVALTTTGAMAQADRPPPPREHRQDRSQRYSIEQATSDKAQLHTIAFSGLAFMTGDFGSDTFLPPGKVSDYFGFQYMRDIDAATGGHNTSFLTKIAQNVLFTLTSEQRAKLVELAEHQQPSIRQFAESRLPLIKAFRENMERPFGRHPSLNQQAVRAYSARLYELDGVIAYERAQVMAQIIRSFSASQRDALSRLKFGDSRTWPDVREPDEHRRLPHDVDVAIMTYASEMFAWWAGSPEADAYFCPERHGMYFGGFGMKTAPAIGKKDYAISTALTGDSGANFLATLTPEQRLQITSIVDQQRGELAGIVEVRRAISTELRRLLSGEQADRGKVLSLSRRYGELDGDLSYRYAHAFATVYPSLSGQQRGTLQQLRDASPQGPKGPFLYSDPIDRDTLNRIGSTDGFFKAIAERPSRSNSPRP